MRKLASYPHVLVFSLQYQLNIKISLIVVLYCVSEINVMNMLVYVGLLVVDMNKQVSYTVR